jgi:low affinity Fe/Cu permease
MQEKFRALAERISNVVGSASSFIAAIVLVLVWIVTGPLFGFSDTWQLVINTGTTIITFLMVFLIQNTQNRDAIAVQLKLDELLRGVQGARTEMINLDMLSDTDLERLHKEFQELGEKNRHGSAMSVAAGVMVKTPPDDVGASSEKDTT